jgi:predicted MPP superfamily phosphohydrolase
LNRRKLTVSDIQGDEVFPAMKMRKISRRQFIAASLLAAPALVLADVKIEPTWLKVRHVRIGSAKPTCRLVHFTDVHHKGDTAYLQYVVNQINSLAPDFVCFTGDIMEDGRYLKEALELFAEIKTPLYGVPGNHDYWSRAKFGAIQKSFATTGGGWLLDQTRTVGSDINLIGITCTHARSQQLPQDPTRKNIVLMHYPAWVKEFAGQKFDLLLAGHSHGGQVRIPFYGPIIVPYLVDQYDLGLYQTDAGPLYVNAGIGYIGHYNFRFNCHPEITLIEV